MSVLVTIYPKQITFNAVVYKGGGASGEGGPIRLRYEDIAQVVKDRTGEDEYPTSVTNVDMDCIVFLSMRDIFPNITKGTKGDMVALVEKDDGTDRTITFANMVYRGATASQDRAAPGDSEHTFDHESADGQTDPITETP